MFAFYLSVFAIVSFATLSLRTPMFQKTFHKSNVGMARNKAPSISIIIPARNEEHRLPMLLDSISLQSKAPMEVIVVDDESTDNTREVAEEYLCQVVSIVDRPKEFAPKPFALHSGAKRASGDVLLFLDSDTKISPDFVEKLSQYFSRDEAGVLSLQPFHVSKSPSQSFALMFHVISIVGSGLLSIFRFSNSLFGPCIAVRRDVYSETGGFSNKNVQSSVIEDVELGSVFKDRKVNTERFLGTGYVEYSMYGSFSSMLSGWRKNIARGAKKSNVFVLASTISLIGAMISLPLHIFNTDALVDERLLFLMQFFILWLLIANVGVRLGNYYLGILLLPVSIFVFLYVFVLALVDLVFRRDAKWAGRNISTR